MTETTAQPLTREDITAAVVEALRPRSLTSDDARAIVAEMLGLGFTHSGSPTDSDFRVPPLASLDRNRRRKRHEDANRARWGLDANESADAAIAERIGDALLKGFGRVSIGEGKCLAAVIDLVAHNSSPSVDGCGGPTVGDGSGAGDASATPAPGGRIHYSCYCGFGISGPRGEGISGDIWNHEQWHRGQEDEERAARERHPAGKGLNADEAPPSRQTLLERLEDAETDLASARVIQERAQVAFEEANGNVGVAVWERAAAADALVASINGGAA